MHSSDHGRVMQGDRHALNQRRMQPVMPAPSQGMIPVSHALAGYQLAPVSMALPMRWGMPVQAMQMGVPTFIPGAAQWSHHIAQRGYIPAGMRMPVQVPMPVPIVHAHGGVSSLGPSPREHQGSVKSTPSYSSSRSHRSGNYASSYPMGYADGDDGDATPRSARSSSRASGRFA